MSPFRFHSLTARYAKLRIAIVGDFCLDRYLEIDLLHTETSIETGLPVHNVVNVRAQPGAAGTIVNNLVALGIGEIIPVGFCGEDGEGYELRRALASLDGVNLDHFLTTSLRRTFTYCKPLILEPGKPPRELNRFDSKNWTPTPSMVTGKLGHSIAELHPHVDALIVMDQVDVGGTGVITPRLLQQLAQPQAGGRDIPIIADSRRGLRGYPPVIFKMNAAELAAMAGLPEGPSLEPIKSSALMLARQNQRAVFVTLAGRGIIGADPAGGVEHVPALPLRGPIDVVGAGDSVTANLAAALAAGATLREAIEFAILASSLVVHQLGTTGTASVKQIGELLPALQGG